MSDLVPLFPLPNVVLFPNVFLPLHIFEPRYRDMVGDALTGDRIIGMALLKPGWQHDYEGRPAIFPIGCTGVMTHVERLADGRYHIVLRGVERFRVIQEDHSRSYRCGLVESIVEAPPTVDDRAIIRHQRAKLEAMLAPAVERERGLAQPVERDFGLAQPGSAPSGGASADPRIPAAMPDADLVNALAQYLDLEPLEKQALLEQSSLRARAQSLVELLEMKVMMARTPGLTNLAH
jgi:Lon protease-like protein